MSKPPAAVCYFYPTDIQPIIIKSKLDGSDHKSELRCSCKPMRVSGRCGKLAKKGGWMTWRPDVMGVQGTSDGGAALVADVFC